MLLLFQPFISGTNSNKNIGSSIPKQNCLPFIHTKHDLFGPGSKLTVQLSIRLDLASPTEARQLSCKKLNLYLKYMRDIYGLKSLAEDF